MKTPQLWWEVMSIMKKLRTKRGITFSMLNQRLEKYLKQRKLKVKGVTPKIIKVLNYALNNGMLTLKVGHYALTSRGRKMNLDAESTDDDDGSVSTPSDSTYTSSTVTTRSRTVSDSTSRESSRERNSPDEKPTSSKKGKSSTKRNTRNDTKRDSKRDTKRDIKNRKGDDKNKKEREEKKNRNEGRASSKSSENLPKAEKHSDDDEKCINDKSCENNSDQDPDPDCRSTCNQGN